jgi:NAD(P)-dependent dehydrogenase (short-subunit alcohol dehydrogenase family)
LFRSALVTGAASGIGRALVERLEADGSEVVSHDLRDGFDVADADAWEAVGPVELACLNAGVTTGVTDVRELTVQAYRRIAQANVDGVVYGVRRLAQVMPRGGSIVATASLAGLTAVPDDPIYAGTKHFVVGFVRSVAEQLEELGLRINAVCPGFADTPMVDDLRERFAAADFPLLRPDDVVEAILAAASSGRTGEAWVVQPGREPMPFRFGGIPGPRVEGRASVAPPL